MSTMDDVRKALEGLPEEDLQRLVRSNMLQEIANAATKAREDRAALEREVQNYDREVAYFLDRAAEADRQLKAGAVGARKTFLEDELAMCRQRVSDAKEGRVAAGAALKGA